MILNPTPKINLGLDILRRRADGFHDIDTLMLPFGGVSDTIEILPTATAGVTLEVEGLTIDCASDRNLVVRAWMLMHQHYGVGGVHIAMRKNIPFGAGLGGGSADAAATLVGLNEVFSLGLSSEELVALAARLGSDVPFFICPRPTFCRGRGEILELAEIDLSGVWCVVTKPGFGIST
ncbi:MAG: 4-(cytidine 5'-diphospho)-2-C-methyl-D-erythritol kinase, partial [Tidjanibacter sp.]|nr:4-(cytidine 5'-diphospho)-2-C-methyl-D-erythritol kinase [Tidjanibacter sp.]